MRAKQSITAQRARFGHCDSTLHILSAPVHPKALRLRRLLGFTPLRSAGKAAGRAMSAGPERGRQTSVRRRRAPQGPGPRSPSPPPTPPRPGHCRAVLRAARGRWEATFRAPRSGPAAARGERDLTPCPHRSSRGANGPSPESGWAARRGARSPRGVASSAAALSDSGSLLLGFRLRTQHWPLNPVLHHRAAPAAPSPLDAVSTSRRRWPGFAVLPPQPPKQLGCQDRIINLVVGGFTCLLILVTLISAFVFPHLPPKPLNVFFAVCISLSSATACILIYWYRQGDLEPKFRSLIYYILFSIIMLCICANLYFHDVGR
ncbi:transmembrane protein 243 isoform X2 [Heterocephalus glaber]|nr:transmembrane protein 243 isoform X2 [Heterocephalus glaber]XP_021109676.1 transmembrane protein 243 isoform X2 [Heterocephalus glaber]XP_021109677.1 transmembrane protein 243 isoform X2 [Heterocephalus glaber]